MPLGSKIWLYTKSIVELERDEFGVYELLDNSDKILYIGCGKVRGSLMTHFEDGTYPITGALNFSVEYTWDEEKSRKRQVEELARYHDENKLYPKYNKPKN
jgi:hypothetical protein